MKSLAYILIFLVAPLASFTPSNKRIIKKEASIANDSIVYNRSLIKIPASTYIKYTPFNCGKRTCSSPRKVDAIILHSTYAKDSKDSFSMKEILSQFKKYRVSAHYIIGRDGKVTRLVPENQISFHGGKGCMPDNKNHINTRSIGIELVNSTYTKYTNHQYASLVRLVKDIENRHKIKYILGHNEIAPDRKTDPWNFEWDLFWKLLRFPNV